MNSYEATKIVFSRIHALDPENASKITGYVLIQEHGEQEMIRLAFGPDTLLHTLILKAKAHLGLTSISLPSTPSTPSSPSTFCPIPIPSRPNINNPLSQHPSPRTNASFNLPSPLPSPPSAAAVPWNHISGFNPSSVSSSSSSSPSYAAVVNNGSSNVCVSNNSSNNSSSNASSITTCSPTSLLPRSSDPFDEYNNNHLLDHHHLSFHNESSVAASKMVDLFDGNSNVMKDGMGSLSLPYGISDTTANWASSESTDVGTQNYHFHRRSLSLSDACFGSENSGSGFGWKPCLHNNARGFCRNGGCKFLHGGGFDDSVDSPVGSPNKLVGMFDQSQEMLRSKAVAAQQHRLAAASQLRHGVSFPYSKCMNFLMSDTQRSAAAALMLGEEFHKFGRCRPERNDFSALGVNPVSRQIYLTFPADSTFREEDVSNYFSIYGPVQDVRIPYQQKRMFGFVTFVYPETVKRILAKGNPHFVCDSRVLVKPYKEKGKVPDKKQQHMERGEYSASSSPSGFDSREPYDLQLGSRMFYNTQERLRRKLEEQADLQQAIELQGRRLMNLQLLDFKNHHHHPYQHNLAVGAPLPSPTQPPTQSNQSLILSSDGIYQEVPEGFPVKITEYSDTPAGSTSPIAASDRREVNAAGIYNGNNGSSEEGSSKVEDCDLSESSLEHILPDSLFASPKKSAGDKLTAFNALEEADDNIVVCTDTNNNTLLSPTSTLGMAAKSSCSFHMPRFSSGNGAIEM